MKNTKLKQMYLRISVIILHPLHQNYNTKRNPWVALYTHITQLMTHTTNVYIGAAAAAYLATMLLSHLAYCRG